MSNLTAVTKEDIQFYQENERRELAKMGAVPKTDLDDLLFCLKALRNLLVLSPTDPILKHPIIIATDAAIAKAEGK